VNQQITAPAQLSTGARAARAHLTRTTVIARQLDEIAAGTVSVRTVPITLDGERRTWVVLDNALGQPIHADRAAHHAAYRLLRHLLPDAPWGTVPLDYNATTGEARDASPTAPAELGIEMVEAAR
jgi:hypothetical protein